MDRIHALKSKNWLVYMQFYVNLLIMASSNSISITNGASLSLVKPIFQVCKTNNTCQGAPFQNPLPGPHLLLFQVIIGSVTLGWQVLIAITTTCLFNKLC